ncbi:hypothetical protein [Mesorhizobium sp.]|uniref:hypothetical protein n=1 Tax=Mesorhizobium sp. TaxID=1871066 RepID=UPI0025C28F85|nr:hypothetical protein [Mesorhizobium sp.]
MSLVDASRRPATVSDEAIRQWLLAVSALADNYMPVSMLPSDTEVRVPITIQAEGKPDAVIGFARQSVLNEGHRGSARCRSPSKPELVMSVYDLSGHSYIPLNWRAKAQPGEIARAVETSGRRLRQ